MLIPRRPRCLLLALCLLVLLGAPSTARADRPLAHEKYQLDNGLTVILHPDPTLPQVVVNIWYHVGTREEPRGRSGFAHLFEHLMFMGTERVPGSQFDIVMESTGARNNASTWFDQTNYYDWGPASSLPTLLWLEADRMESLARAMTQEKLDLQRDVVRNERRESYDNAPYGPSELIVWERMFPADHPYHYHVIGSHEDLLAASVADVVSFFDTYYVPNNASLVVAGDFEPAQVKPLLAALFGSIPRGKVPPRRSAPGARLDRVERLTVADAVQLPRVRMTWHSPAFYAPGDAAMDLLAAALAAGENGRLRKRLVRTEEIAVDVAAWQTSLRLGSLFSIQATARPGVSLERLEAVIDEEVARLLADGPTPRELERAVAELETSTLTRLESLQERADQLNAYDALLGSPDRVEWDLDRFRKSTPQTVRDWGRRVLDPDRRFILRVVPATPVETAAARDQRPADLPARAFDPPAPAVFRLPNGLEVWHVDRPGLPLVSATLLLRGGGAQVPAAKAGLAALTATMLSEGTASRDALAFADELDVLGAQFGVGAGYEDVALSLTVLERNADPAFALLAEAVRTPRFATADFERVRALHEAQLQRLVDEPTAMAPRVAAQAFFGDDAYGRPLDGYPDTVKGLTVPDVRAFHAAHHRPEGATLVLAGDLRLEAARALVTRHLGAWAGAAPAASSSPEAASGPDRLRVVLVDKPGAAQTTVRFVYPAVGFQSEERVGLDVLNSLFGGAFTSRLNANLREAHGYTYGASSRFGAFRGRGAFVASANVQTDVTGAALGEFFAEFARIQEGGVSVEEAQRARASSRYDVVNAFESLDGVVGAYVPYARYRLPAARLAADLLRVEPLEPSDLDTLAARRIARGAGVLILIGDQAKVRPQLEGLGLSLPAPVGMADALAGRLPR